MKTRSLRWHLVSHGCVAALAFTSNLWAQPAPAGKPAAPATADDAPVVMAEFNVAGTSDGWVATNTLSGTRTNMELRDLPRSIQVLTSEFMNDIGALTLTDASDFMSGITNVGNQDQTNDNNTYQVRGFRQNKPYRNGVREPFAGMVFDSSTMDRVEVLKGPSSLLSGVVEPGGMLNSISKAPGSKREASVTLRGDNWGMKRGEVDATIPLSKRLSSRLIWVRQSGDGWQQYSWSNRTVLYGSLAYKLTPNTRFVTNVEYIDYLAALPSPRSTVSTAASSVLAGLTWHRNGAVNGLNLNGVYIPWDFNPLGPNNRRDQQIMRTSNQLEHRFNSTFSLRVSGNYTHMHRVDRRLSGTQLTTGRVNGLEVPVSAALASTNDDETVNTYTGQGDLVGRFKYWGIEHQAILGAEYIDSDNKRIRDNTPALTPYLFSATNQPAWTEMLDSSRYTLPNTRLKSAVKRHAFSFTNVLALFESRFFVMAGVRHDAGTIINQNPIATNELGRYQKVIENADSPTMGLTYRVTDWLSVFSSTSRSFAGVPVGGVDMFGDPLSKHISGKGLDAGIKAALFKNRIFLNATAFQVDQLNGTRTALTADFIEAGLDPTQVTGSRSIQDVSARSRGWETDITMKLFQGHQVAVTYTNLHAFVLANRSSPNSVGGPLSQGPGRESWSVFQKFELPGQTLKGLTLTHSIVFRDSRRPTVPGFTRQDVSASYRTTLFKQRVSFVVGVKNLQDIMYWEGFQSRGAPRTTSFSLNTRF
jgi:iron complex outermembrane receptor protein